VANFVNSLGIISGSIPVPVSFILTTAAAPLPLLLLLLLVSFFSIVIEIVPSSVNLTALVSKVDIT
jgi:hypothetical protein